MLCPGVVAGRGAGLQRAVRDLDGAQYIAGWSVVRRTPVTSSAMGILRSPPASGHTTATPSNPTASAIIGPAGSARQTFPPTVASREILNDPASAAQH